VSASRLRVDQHHIRWARFPVAEPEPWRKRQVTAWRELRDGLSEVLCLIEVHHLHSEVTRQVPAK
jgi:hypothetical protein